MTIRQAKANITSVSEHLRKSDIIIIRIDEVCDEPYITTMVDFLCSFLPQPALETTVNSSFFELLSKGVAVVGYANFIMMLGSVLFWYVAQLVWAVVEWVYKKIPGVN